MVAARPLVGYGEDALGLVFGRFLSGDYSPGVIFDRAHSAPLDLAATQGLLGLAAAGWFWSVWWLGVWRGRRLEEVASLGAAWVAYALWALLNFDWAPATGPLLLLAGIGWSAVRAEQVVRVSTAPPPAQPAAWRSLVAVGLVVAGALVGTLPLAADALHYSGRPAAAAALDPLQAQYHWALGEQRLAAGDVGGAVAELARAAELGEYDPAAYVEWGDAERGRGREREAEAAYRRALQVDPYYAPARERLGLP